MSGGGSLLRNIDKLLTQVTGVPCHVAENSLNCVALGTGLALEHFDFFKKSLVVDGRAAGRSRAPTAHRARRRAPTRPGVAGRGFVDLHVHTSASFDSLASPESVVGRRPRRAASPTSRSPTTTRSRARSRPRGCFT